MVLYKWQKILEKKLFKKKKRFQLICAVCGNFLKINVSRDILVFDDFYGTEICSSLQNY